jgi:hypothetical protein
MVDASPLLRIVLSVFCSDKRQEKEALGIPVKCGSTVNSSRTIDELRLSREPKLTQNVVVCSLSK